MNTSKPARGPRASAVAGLLLAALAVLAGGSLRSTFGQSAGPVSARHTAFSSAASPNAADISAAGDEDVVRVDARLSRVLVSVEQPGPFTWEVSDSGREQRDLLVDGPERPLQLVVLLDLVAGKEKKGEAGHYQRLQQQLDQLEARAGLQSHPAVVISSPRVDRLPYGIKLPASWETVYAGDLRGALDEGIRRLERGPGNVRRSLLFLTNRADELPRDTFSRTDARLAHSAALVYLMAVKPPKFGAGRGGHNKVILRTNINGGDTTIFLGDGYNYLATLFDLFVTRARTMYVVSYRLPEEELGDSAQPSTRYVRVSAHSPETGKVLAWNERHYVLGLEDAHATATAPVAASSVPTPTPPPPGDPVMRAAITSVTATCVVASENPRPCTPKTLLSVQIATRELHERPRDDEERLRFRQELQAMPELQGKLHGPDSDEAKKFRDVIRPVLKLYELDGAMETWVLDQDSPGMFTFREFALIVTTGELRLLSKAQLRAAAAHECSHLFFVNELIAADAARDIPAHHITEYKCDIYASLASQVLGDGAESVTDAVKIIEAWYDKANRNDYDKTLHPSARQRQECLSLFLRRGSS